jgi:hypothetical protein
MIVTAMITVKTPHLDLLPGQRLDRLAIHNRIAEFGIFHDDEFQLVCLMSSVRDVAVTW